MDNARGSQEQARVVAYSFSPPDLSEVFLGAVGRDKDREEIDHA